MAAKVLILLLILAITLLTIDRTSAGFYNDPSEIPTAPAFNAAWNGFHSLSGSHVGQHVDGLSKLKSFFFDFGYIPPTSTGDFSNDYDESLVSAVKLYQQNFGIGVTGELDDETITHLVKPRCGVADIINGTNTMASKPTLVGRYTYLQGSAHRWPVEKATLSYAFLPANQLPDPIKSVFARAFAHWSAVIPLNFTETDTYSEADVKIGFYSGDHGDGRPFDGVLGVLGHSFAPTDGRLHVDSAETWVYDADVTQSSVESAMDLESVATHEIGHILGLNHTLDETAVMFAYISPKTRKVDLADDDVNGIQSLYGNIPGGRTPTSGQHQRNSASGGGAWLLRRWRESLLGFAAVLCCLLF